MKRILTLYLMLFISFASFASESWKQIASEDGIKIYSQTAKNGTIPFKAQGVINKNINEVYSILADHQNKNKWAPKLKNVQVHKQKDNEYIFSEYYSTPWPASDREFLLKGTIEHKSENEIIFKAHSINNQNLKDKSHVQADVKFLNVNLRKVDEYKTQINFEFHGDMKGWMPLWLTNLIQKKWPLRFIQGLNKYSPNTKITKAN